MSLVQPNIAKNKALELPLAQGLYCWQYLLPANNSISGDAKHPKISKSML